MNILGLPQQLVLDARKETCLTTSQKLFATMKVVQETRCSLPPLLPVLGIMELLYVLLFALSSLPSLHMSDSPVPDTYPWTLAPSHLLQALFGPLQNSWLPFLLFALVIILLLALYVWLFVLLLRKPIVHSSRRWLVLLLAGTFLFGLTLFFQPKLFSDDVFTYIFSGRILVVYGADPLNTAPIQFPHDPYLQWVISGRYAPNIYGPLWLCISSLLVALGTAPAPTLLLFKGVTLLAHLLNCVLIWAILSKIAPSRRFLGTLLYAWNPLVLIELAGSGHSEGVLLFVFLFAVWLHIHFEHSGRWRTVGVLVILGVAVSINLIALLLPPLYIWFDLRQQKHLLRLLWGCFWRALVLLVPAMGISFPFWRGAPTFFAITSAIDMAHFVHSPIGALAAPLRVTFIFVARTLHFPPFLHPVTAADITLRSSATFIFVLIYANLFSQVRHVPTTMDASAYTDTDTMTALSGIDVLLNSWGRAVFWYMILVSGWFWPWYMLWILWAVVLRRFDAFTKTVLILSGTSLLFYPLQGFARGPIMTYQPALIFGVALIYYMFAGNRERKKERTQALYDGRGQTAQN